ncbi:carbon-nitrogen hydrolase [Ophiocordyceps camponoti-floridani]|uniref:Carbon-nitrogen hydrolase n=1 Tax=Ophiocordyceps camponoti-floridani TaxID=2030778 RepID=A0A8H4Q1H0_9HYPO|nr:carbon-nitrogen hydrolase [Ophiocordyceps camponoti-floridani]
MATLAAVGQICASASIKANLDQCVRLVVEAAAKGAKIIFFPEASDYIAPDAETALSLAQSQSSSPFVHGLQQAARKHSIAIHVGIHALPPRGTHLVNRALYITPQGETPPNTSYDKVHVFDYGPLRESATTLPGTSLTPPFSTPVGLLGSLICFDVRFAEAAITLSRWRRGPARVLTYPSAFTVRTGAAHWEVLLRARAIETQSWVVAAAQVGFHQGGRSSFGTSLVVDPWGRVVLKLAGLREDGVLESDDAIGQLGFVEIDPTAADRIRSEMPLQRRTDVYPALT